MSTVLGVGIGVFVLLVLLAASVTTCFLGSGSRYSSQISIGTTAVFFLVAIVLLVSPRGETSKGDVESEISGYDETVTHRALMLSSLLMASLAAGIGFLTTHMLAPAHAKPLDYKADVLDA